MWHHYLLEAGTSRNKKNPLELMASTSNHMVTEISSQNSFEEIKHIDERLRILEEEAEMLKKTLMESLEERTRLMTQIYKYFETLQLCLVQGEQEMGVTSKDGVMMIKPLKDRRVGLLQVLCHESNPSLVTRDLRPKAVGLGFS
ncbi:uncharacterized protein Fot_08520 [Forsythia ovata]|uniref:Uncharacterized protein n=1 Tax=Forsythia ovata TaxID=205694 RepID=A0ABD1WZ96_9LAMI